jgi:hypothetical protein
MLFYPPGYNTLFICHLQIWGPIPFGEGFLMGGVAMMRA